MMWILIKWKGIEEKSIKITIIIVIRLRFRIQLYDDDFIILIMNVKIVHVPNETLFFIGFCSGFSYVNFWVNSIENLDNFFFGGWWIYVEF